MSSWSRSGVEALEDLLGVRVGAESDGDVLEALEAPPDALGLARGHLAAEEGVVVVETGVALLPVGAAVEHDALEDLRPSAVRPKGRTDRIGAANEHPFELCRELGVAVAHRVVQGGDEQHDRRDALLAVDEHELVGAFAIARRREDRAEEVALLLVGVGDGADVGEQLLASADVPAVLALVDRDDDRGACREPVDRVDGGRIDVRGGARHVTITPRGSR
jgi:hypothetical protein